MTVAEGRDCDQLSIDLKVWGHGGGWKVIRHELRVGMISDARMSAPMVELRVAVSHPAILSLNCLVKVAKEKSRSFDSPPPN